MASAAAAAPPGGSNTKYPVKKVKILDLRPSQFSLGYQQVNHKADKMRKMTDAELDQMLKTKLVPVVKGPNGDFHILDHHHMCRALLKNAKAGDDKSGAISDEVFVEIREDHKGENEFTFWQWMLEKGHVWPCDEHGEYVRDFNKELPDTVAKLENDPYRSLAAVVRQKAFPKSDRLFAEFLLANYFRSRIAMDRDPKLKKISESTVSQAITMAQQLSLDEQKVYGFMPLNPVPTPAPAPTPLTPPAVSA